MLGQDVLDLRRVHVLPTRDDHVLRATTDVEVAILTAPAEVPRPEPTVADRRRGEVGRVPVPGGDHGSGGDDLAHLAVRDRPTFLVDHLVGLRAERATDRARVGIELLVPAPGDHAGLGQPVAHRDGDVVPACAEPGDGRRGAVVASHQDEPQRGEADGLVGVGGQERLDHPREDEGVGHRVAIDQVGHLLGRPPAAREDAHGPAEEERRDAEIVERRGVVRGTGDERDGVGRHLRVERRLLQGEPHDGRVRQHHALGPAGRARRVEDEMGLCRRERAGDRRRRREALVLRAGRVGREGDDLEVGQPLRRGLGDVGQRRLGDEEPRPAVAEHELHLGCDHAEVDRDQREPGVGAGEVDLERLTAVVEQRRDPVADTEAGGPQPGREAHAAIPQLRVGPTGVAPPQCRRARVDVGGKVGVTEDPSDGGRGIGHAGRVEREIGHRGRSDLPAGEGAQQPGEVQTVPTADDRLRRHPDRRGRAVRNRHDGREPPPPTSRVPHAANLARPRSGCQELFRTSDTERCRGRQDACRRGPHAAGRPAVSAGQTVGARAPAGSS